MLTCKYLHFQGKESSEAKSPTPAIFASKTTNLRRVKCVGYVCSTVYMQTVIQKPVCSQRSWKERGERDGKNREMGDLLKSALYPAAQLSPKCASHNILRSTTKSERMWLTDSAQRVGGSSSLQKQLCCQRWPRVHSQTHTLLMHKILDVSLKPAFNLRVIWLRVTKTPHRIINVYMRLVLD